MDIGAKHARENTCKSKHGTCVLAFGLDEKLTFAMPIVFYVSGLLRPSQDKPSQAKANAQDENPRRGFTKYQLSSHAMCILKMVPQHQEAEAYVFSLPQKPT